LAEPAQDPCGKGVEEEKDRPCTHPHVVLLDLLF